MNRLFLLLFTSILIITGVRCYHNPAGPCDDSPCECRHDTAYVTRPVVDDGKTSVIGGSVRWHGIVPPMSMEVTLTSSDSTQVGLGKRAHTTSLGLDSNGEFSFRVVPGRYQVSVQPADSSVRETITLSSSLTIDTVAAAAETLRIDIHLPTVELRAIPYSSGVYLNWDLKDYETSSRLLRSKGGEKWDTLITYHNTSINRGVNYIPYHYDDMESFTPHHYRLDWVSSLTGKTVQGPPVYAEKTEHTKFTYAKVFSVKNYHDHVKISGGVNGDIYHNQRPFVTIYRSSPFPDSFDSIGLAELAFDTEMYLLSTFDYRDTVVDTGLYWYKARLTTTSGLEAFTNTQAVHHTADTMPRLDARGSRRIELYFVCQESRIAANDIVLYRGPYPEGPLAPIDTVHCEGQPYADIGHIDSTAPPDTLIYGYSQLTTDMKNRIYRSQPVIHSRSGEPPELTCTGLNPGISVKVKSDEPGEVYSFVLYRSGRPDTNLTAIDTVQKLRSGHDAAVEDLSAPLDTLYYAAAMLYPDGSLSPRSELVRCINSFSISLPSPGLSTERLSMDQADISIDGSPCDRPVVLRRATVFDTVVIDTFDIRTTFDTTAGWGDQITVRRHTDTTITDTIDPQWIYTYIAHYLPEGAEEYKARETKLHRWRTTSESWIALDKEVLYEHGIGLRIRWEVEDSTEQDTVVVLRWKASTSSKKTIHSFPFPGNHADTLLRDSVSQTGFYVYQAAIIRSDQVYCESSTLHSFMESGLSTPGPLDADVSEAVVRLDFEPPLGDTIEIFRTTDPALRFESLAAFAPPSRTAYRDTLTTADIYYYRHRYKFEGEWSKLSEIVAVYSPGSEEQE